MAKMVIGSTQIKKIYLGTQEVNKVYIGNKLVYSKETTSTTNNEQNK